MTATLDQPAIVAVAGRPGALRRLTQNPVVAVGLAILLALIAIVLLAPVLPLADPNVTDVAIRLKPPFTEGHILGTDQLGRDMLSRLIWGTRASLAVGFAAAIAAAVIGSTIGIVAGFYGRVADMVLRFASPAHAAVRSQAICRARTPLRHRLGYQGLSPLTG